MSLCYIYQSLHESDLIPCINARHKSNILGMRGEVQHVLKENGLNERDFVYIDQVFARCQNPQLFLVDHNEIAGPWKRFYLGEGIRFIILGILDHHKDAGCYKDCVDMRRIEVCGSTATLLVDTVLEEGDPERIFRLNQIAKPLMQTILFDTVNLTWRQTEKDIKAVKYLEGLLCCGDLFSELELAVQKIPENSLGVYNLLHKDYKLYEHISSSGPLYYGISTIHLPLKSMIENSSIDQWSAKVRKFMDEQGLHLLLLTIAYRITGIECHLQELAIFVRRPADLPALHGLLQSNDAQLLPMDDYSSSSTDFIFACYKQANITISRKQLHPISKEFMSAHYP